MLGLGFTGLGAADSVQTGWIDPRVPLGIALIALAADFNPPAISFAENIWRYRASRPICIFLCLAKCVFESAHRQSRNHSRNHISIIRIYLL